MITIVSAKAQRLIKILNRLPRNYGYLSYEYIQSFNSCSINTAYADAKFILEQWEDILDLKLVDKGIISLNKSDSDFEHVRRIILKDEFELALIWTIFSKPNLTTTEYSGMLSCSESHFRKSISSINQSYVKYQVYIKYNEKNRTWKFSSDSYLMGAQVLTRISEICQYNLDEFENDDIDYSSIYFTFLEGCLEREYSFFNKFMSILKHYIFTVEQHHPNLLEDIFNERTRSNFSFEDFNDKLNSISKENNLKNILIHKEKHDPSSFTSYMYYLYFRDSLFDEWIKPELGRYENVLHRLNNEMPDFVDYVRQFVEKVDTELNSKLSNYIEEIAIWAYINVDYLRMPVYRKIGIISDLGKDHINVLASLLYEHFDGIECIDISNDTRDKSENMDIIISNSKYILHKYNVSSKPHIVLSDIVTIDEISSIYTMLYNVKQKRKVYDR